MSEKRIFEVEPQQNATISEEDTITGESQERTRARVTTIDPDFLISYDEAVSLHQQISLNISEAELPAARADFWFVITPQNPDDIDIFGFDRNERFVYETIPVLDSVLDVYYEHSETFECSDGLHTNIKSGYNLSNSVKQSFNDDGTVNPIVIPLPDYYNCFSYANGIEEFKILGEFNETGLLKGVKASTVNSAYQQDDKLSFLIHSGIFNDNRNLNRLNEFNTNTIIEKELDISEGSIQKLHARDTNLIVFQEDKVINVPINKNLIQSAGGGGSLTTGSQFFGTERSYTGEYGISTNPESFCTYGSRIYFADKNRGCLCQLDNNGIVEISKNGMESWVRDNIAQAHVIIGQYDDYHKQALFTFRGIPLAAIGGSNEGTIEISYDGRNSSRTECNRTPSLMVFKTFYTFVIDETTVNLGDVVFTDVERTILFDGNYRWYRVQEGTSYDKLYQISPYGLVTGIEPDCSSQPPDTARQLFDISSESFNNPRDACANGTIDTIAWHDTANSAEVIIDSFVYDEKDDLIISPRTGWYIISEGFEKFVIDLDNGKVINKIDCDVISLNRRPILGSNVINLPSTLPPAERNLRLCGASFATHVYWFNGIERLPAVGTIIYENDHNFDITVGDWDILEEYIPEKVVRYNDASYRAIVTNTGVQPDSDTTMWAPITGFLYLQFSRGDFIRIAPAVSGSTVTVGDAAIGATEITASTASDAVTTLRGLRFNEGFQTITGTNFTTGVITFTPALTTAIVSGTELDIEGTTTRYNVDAGQGIVVENGKCSELLCFLSPNQLFGRPTNNRNIEVDGAVTGASQMGVTTFDVTSALIGETFISNGLLHEITGVNNNSETIFFTPNLTADIAAGTFIGLIGAPSNPFDFYFLGVNGIPVQNAEIEFIVEGERTYGPFRVNATRTSNINGVDVVELYESDILLDTNNFQTGAATPITLDIGTDTTNVITLPTPDDDDFRIEAAKATFAEDVRVVITSLCYRGRTALGVTPAYISLVPFTRNAIDNKTMCTGALVPTGTTPDGQTVYYDPDESPKQYFLDVDLNDKIQTGAGDYAVSYLDPQESEGGAVISNIERLDADGIVEASQTLYCDYPYKYELGYTNIDTTEAQQSACDFPNTVTIHADQPEENFDGDDLNRVTGLRLVNATGGQEIADDGFYTDGTLGSQLGLIRLQTSGTLGDNVGTCSLGYTATVNVTNNVTPANTSRIRYTGTASPTTNSDVGVNGTPFNITAIIESETGYELNSDVEYRIGGTGSYTTGREVPFTGTFGTQDVDQSVEWRGTTSLSSGYDASLTVVDSVSGGSIGVSGTTSRRETDSNATGSFTVTITPPSGRTFNSGWTINNVNQGGAQSGNFTFNYSSSNRTMTIVVSGSSTEIPPSSCFIASIGVPSGSTATYNWGGFSSNSSICGTPGTSLGTFTASASASPGRTFVGGTGPFPFTQSGLVFPANGVTTTISGTVGGTTVEEDNPTITLLHAGTQASVCSSGVSRTFNANQSTFNSSLQLRANTKGTALLNENIFIRVDGEDTVFNWTGSSLLSAPACVTTSPKTGSAGFSLSATACGTATAQTIYVLPAGSTSLSTLNTLYADGDGDNTNLHATTFVRRGNSNRQWNQSTGFSSTIGICNSQSIDPNPVAQFPTQVNTTTGTITVVGESRQLTLSANGGTVSFGDGTPSYSARLDIIGIGVIAVVNSNVTGGFTEGDNVRVSEGTYNYSYEQVSNRVAGGVSLAFESF